MNIFSKAALFFMMAAANLTHVSVLANDREINPDEGVKLDAFVALMEARRGARYCFGLMGCNTPGYDYCLNVSIVAWAAARVTGGRQVASEPAQVQVLTSIWNSM